MSIVIVMYQHKSIKSKKKLVPIFLMVNKKTHANLSSPFQLYVAGECYRQVGMSLIV